MQDIIIAKSKINSAALDADLRSALGANLLGISAGPYGVCVHLADNAAPAQVEQTRALVLAHDATKLTANQQAEANRQAKLEQARSEYGAAEVDLNAYSGQSALIQQLAQKIAWLEREMADVRAGQ